MMDDLYRITEDDQTNAERRNARTLAIALAGDIGAFYGALKGSGVEGELLADLTRQFQERWIPGDEVESTIYVNTYPGDE